MPPSDGSPVAIAQARASSAAAPALARPRIGLALSGGGARGIAHLGVLLALQEEGIPIEVIAGTSMGAIIGGYAAAAVPVAHVIAEADAADWDQLFLDEPRPASGVTAGYFGFLPSLIDLGIDNWKLDIPYGLIDAQRISELFFRDTAAASFAARNDFDSLAVRYRAIAVDIATGQRVVLGEGELSQAMRASIAIPFLFTPAHLGNRLLIDGGVIDVLPVDVAFDLGADHVIAVDVVPPLEPGVPRRAVDIGLRTIDIMVNLNEEEQLARADVVIRPDIGRHSEMNYSRLHALVDAGYRAAREKMPEIRRLLAARDAGADSASAAASEATRGRPRALDLGLLSEARVASVAIAGRDRVDERFIFRRFGMRAGERFRLPRALREIRRLYETWLFENVWLELERLPDDRAAVRVHVLERYPASIAFGGNVSEEWGPTGFAQGIFFDPLGRQERIIATLIAGHETGRISLALLRDLPTTLPALVEIEGGFREEEPELFDAAGRREARLEVHGRWAGATLRARPGDVLVASIGADFEHVRRGALPRQGLSRYEADRVRVHASALCDTRDLPVFERHGVRALLAWQGVLPDGTEQSDFHQVLARFLGVSAYRRHTFLAHADAGFSWTGENAAQTRAEAPPIQDWFRIGGPVELPGFHREGLWGRDFLAFGLAWRARLYRRLHLEIAGALGDVFDEPENVRWRSLHRGVAAGLLLPTPVGPLGVHYGRADGGREQFYLALGYALDELRR